MIRARLGAGPFSEITRRRGYGKGQSATNVGPKTSSRRCLVGIGLELGQKDALSCSLVSVRAITADIGLLLKLTRRWGMPAGM
jgi:hypothetical protein